MLLWDVDAPLKSAEKSVTMLRLYCQGATGILFYVAPGICIGMPVYYHIYLSKRWRVWVRFQYLSPPGHIESNL